MTRWDAVIVGAGPAGSATALLLARAGARVLLLDRARFPRDKPCSEYLSPQTTRILTALGPDVLGAVEASAHAKLYGMRVVAPDGSEMYGSFTGRGGGRRRWSSPRPYGFALARTRFDAILRDAAEHAGAVIREATAVEDLLYDRGAVGGVVARTENAGRMTEHASVVIGADGLHSIVARRLGLQRNGRPRRIAFTAHVAGAAEIGERGEMHIGAHGYVGLGPIGDGVTTVALVLPQQAVAARGRAFRSGFLAELDRFPRLRGRFAAARLVREVLVTGPFAQWSRRSFASGAALVGDAADFFDPFTGQGIYSALRGAELLAETLLSGVSLEAYARARRRAFAGKWVLERLIGLGVGWPALATRVVRRLARRPDLADLVVGATGNFVPARAVLAPASLLRLLL